MIITKNQIIDYFKSGIRDTKDFKIGIIGLGYVGLPLAVEFAKKYPVVGFDINRDRVKELQDCKDHTLEVNSKVLKEVNVKSYEKLQSCNGFLASYDLLDLQGCNFYIVTVPTPIDNHKRPDLSALKKSSEIVGSVLKKDDIVIYESTVYPGATEEFCVPILEKQSGLKFNTDFFFVHCPL